MHRRLLLASVFLTAACSAQGISGPSIGSQKGLAVQAPTQYSTFSTEATETLAAAIQGETSDRIPAYYDGKLFPIILKPLSTKAAAATLAHNKSINIIYTCFPADGVNFPGGFTPVLDAIQGDGFNALWQEVFVHPTPLFISLGLTQTTSNPPLTSDDNIAAAVEAGLVTLVPTDEVYICPIVGPKKK